MQNTSEDRQQNEGETIAPLSTPSSAPSSSPSSAPSFTPPFTQPLTRQGDITPTNHLMAGAGARVLLPVVVPVLEDLDFTLVRMRLIGADMGAAPKGKSTKNAKKVLQIMAENKEGTLTLGECETISRALSALLDVEDLISGAYALEVSSAGLERPLTRLADFETYKGARVKLKTIRPIISNDKARSRFQGILCGIENDELLLEVALENYSAPQVLGFAFSQISEVILHPSAAEISNLLNTLKD